MQCSAECSSTSYIFFSSTFKKKKNWRESSQLPKHLVVTRHLSKFESTNKRNWHSKTGLLNLSPKFIYSKKLALICLSCLLVCSRKITINAAGAISKVSFCLKLFNTFQIIKFQTMQCKINFMFLCKITINATYSLLILTITNQSNLIFTSFISI